MCYEDLQIFQCFNVLIEECYVEYWLLLFYVSWIGVIEVCFNDVCWCIVDLLLKCLVYEWFMQEFKCLLLFIGGLVNEICYQFGFKDLVYFSCFFVCYVGFIFSVYCQ